jgi:hypothetical protein
VLDQFDERLGDDFPLWDLLEKFDRENDFTEDINAHRKRKGLPPINTPPPAPPAEHKDEKKAPAAGAGKDAKEAKDAKESKDANAPAAKVPAVPPAKTSATSPADSRKK